MTRRRRTSPLQLPAAASPTTRRVLLAHGGGGRLMHQLIEQHVPAGLRQPAARRRGTTARCSTLGGARLAFTTDSYVVQPAVLPRRRHRHAGRQRHGQRPGHVRRAAALPERGLHPRRRACRWRRSGASCASMQRGRARRRACRSSPATPRSSTAARATASSSTPPGIGVVEHGARHRARRACAPGDAVLLSGDVGRHGMAIMAVREGLEFETHDRERLRAARAAGAMELLDVGRRASTACAT